MAIVRRSGLRRRPDATTAKRDAEVCPRRTGPHKQKGPETLMASRGRLRQPPNLEWKPGNRQLPAAAVAVAVTPVAVAIPVAVRGIAVAVAIRGIAVAVAARGIAVAIPAIRAVTIAVAVIIGGGLGGGEAGR